MMVRLNIAAVNLKVVGISTLFAQFWLSWAHCAPIVKQVFDVWRRNQPVPLVKCEFRRLFKLPCNEFIQIIIYKSLYNQL